MGSRLRKLKEEESVIAKKKPRLELSHQIIKTLWSYYLKSITDNTNKNLEEISDSIYPLTATHDNSPHRFCPHGAS